MSNPPAIFSIIADIVAALGTPSTYTVYDGPQPTSANPTKFILVGSDGETASSGRWTTDWLAMGSRADRKETGEIACLVQSWDGSTDNVASKRADVQSMLADLAAAAYSVADASVEAYWGLTDGTELEQEQTQEGLTVRAKVTIRYELARA